jgi:single-strand DNA-binding protein
MQNINRVVLTGNLTKDPELREFPSGGNVCSLRLAVNGRRKNPQTGEWEDQANYFDISVFGAQGENCSRYLAKGRAVAVDGRLRWREFTRQDGSKGQAVDVVAETVQFLGGGDANGSGSRAPTSADRSSGSGTQFDTGDFDTSPLPSGTAGEDDIPF